MYVLLMLLLLNVIILIHESGHYIAAKMVNIKPKSIVIGFGKTLWQYESKNGVILKFNLLPVGGCVDFDMKEFNNESPYKRFLVLFSGVFFNFIAAVIVSFIFVMVVKIPIFYDTNTFKPLPWNFTTAIVYTCQSVFNTFELVIKGLYALFLRPDVNELVGPIQIMRDGARFLEQDIILLLPLFILLDVNILVINLIPFPALDGGRIAFSILEMITKHKLKWEEKIHFAGLVLLVIFMAFLLGKDVFEVFSYSIRQI